LSQFAAHGFEFTKNYEININDTIENDRKEMSRSNPNNLCSVFFIFLGRIEQSR